jgi:hypothetical protein
MDVFFAAFSGAWFGIFVLAFIVIGIVANEMDSFWMGAATLLVGLAGMEFLFEVPVWASVFANPFMLVLYAALYVAVGAIYTGMWSWPNYIREHESRIKLDYGDFRNNAKRSGNEVTFDDYLDSKDYRYKASGHKDRLAAWVLMWPFGLLWDLLHRPARWVWHTVYSGFGEVFERVSKQTARKMHNDHK